MNDTKKTLKTKSVLLSLSWNVISLPQNFPFPHPICQRQQFPFLLVVSSCDSISPIFLKSVYKYFSFSCFIILYTYFLIWQFQTSAVTSYSRAHWVLALFCCLPRAHTLPLPLPYCGSIATEINITYLHHFDYKYLNMSHPHHVVCYDYYFLCLPRFLSTFYQFFCKLWAEF